MFLISEYYLLIFPNNFVVVIWPLIHLPYHIVPPIGKSEIFQILEIQDRDMLKAHFTW